MKILARLTASSPPMGEPRGGRVTLTSSDIAAACKGLTADEMNLISYKWMGDESAEGPLLESLFYRVAQMAVEKNWKQPEGYIGKMVRMAVDEICHGVCTTCEGVGHRQDAEGKVYSCRSCGGTGHMKMGSAERSERLGCNPQDWRRTWRHRYEQVYQILAYFESDAIRRVYNNLKDGEIDEAKIAVMNGAKSQHGV